MKRILLLFLLLLAACVEQPTEPTPVVEQPVEEVQQEEPTPEPTPEEPAEEPVAEVEDEPADTREKMSSEDIANQVVEIEMRYPTLEKDINSDETGEVIGRYFFAGVFLENNIIVTDAEEFHRFRNKCPSLRCTLEAHIPGEETQQVDWISLSPTYNVAVLSSPTLTKKEPVKTVQAEVGDMLYFVDNKQQVTESELLGEERKAVGKDKSERSTLQVKFDKEDIETSTMVFNEYGELVGMFREVMGGGHSVVPATAMVKAVSNADIRMLDLRTRTQDFERENIDDKVSGIVAQSPHEVVRKPGVVEEITFFLQNRKDEFQLCVDLTVFDTNGVVQGSTSSNFGTYGADAYEEVILDKVIRTAATKIAYIIDVKDCEREKVLSTLYGSA